jgi:tetratricopeptide (TPR) repeat protein
MVNLLETETTAETYRYLKNGLQRKQGFGLFFVQCSPAVGHKLFEDIKKDFSAKHTAILSLEQEIDDLYSLIAEKKIQETIDILFIQGLDKSLIPYLQSEPSFQLTLSGEKNIHGGQGNYYRLDTVPPILAHLNLQRERFRDNFKFCLVFLLPKFALKYLIRRAPDFFDWRSGVFEFIEDQDKMNFGKYEEYLTLASDERYAKILEIKDVIEQHLQTQENQALLWLEIGDLYFADKNYAEALLSFDQALKIKPQIYKAWYYRGNALVRLGRFEEAIISYDQALKFNPDDEQSWFNRGLALGSFGKIQEEILSYDQALKIEPYFHKAWYNRGVALGALGNIEEEIISYNEALKIEPNYPQAWYNKSCAYTLQSKTQLALESLEKAISLDEQYREMTQTDSDFDTIRNDPAFQALIFNKT